MISSHIKMGQKEIWIIDDLEPRQGTYVAMTPQVLASVCTSPLVATEPLQGQLIYTGYFSYTRNEEKTEEIKLLVISSQMFEKLYDGVIQGILNSSQVAGIVYVTWHHSVKNFRPLLGATCPNEHGLTKSSSRSQSNLAFRDNLKSSPWYQNGCPFVYFKKIKGELDREFFSNELFEEYGFRRYYSMAFGYRKEFEDSQRFRDVSDLLVTFVN